MGARPVVATHWHVPGVPHMVYYKTPDSHIPVSVWSNGMPGVPSEMTPLQMRTFTIPNKGQEALAYLGYAGLLRRTARRRLCSFTAT